MEDIFLTIVLRKLTSTCAQLSATPEELGAVADRLLLAMHDLRSVLVRKKSQQIAKASKTDES